MTADRPDPLGDPGGASRTRAARRSRCARSQNANYDRPNNDAVAVSAGVGITSAPHWLHGSNAVILLLNAPKDGK